MSVITETKNLWDNIDGKGIAAEYSEYAERATSDEDGHNLLLTLESFHVTEIGSQKLAADTDLNGNSLELTISNNTVTAIGGKSIAGSGGGVVVDSALSSTSENPVQNKVVYAAIEGVKGIIKDGGTLTDAALINVPNNAVSTLTTAQSALTLNVNLASGEIPNFAVEITTSAAVTLTVTKTVGNGSPVELYPSEAGGTSLESGKLYQVT